jgi:acetoin utilization deacetylase AcuC-like enzyme
MATGFLYDPIVLEHDTRDHPENARRITASLDLLASSGLLARLTPITARDAAPAELALVHDPRYVDAIRQAARNGGGWADPDTLITPRSYDVAARVVGGTLAAVDAVLSGGVANAFCLVRPPGHHAGPSQAMGFCLFNHIAVAARYAQRTHGLDRVAIVDYDVHHGNGTQDTFYDDASVLYVSTHEYPFYPGTGAADETGAGPGVGANINIPMPHYAGDSEHRRAFEDIVLPALRRFRPQLILVSAGYDAHFADELAYQELSVDGYGALVSMLLEAAGDLFDGRIVFALEGGYHLTALPWSIRRTLELMRGDTPTPDPLGRPAPHATEDIAPTLATLRRLHNL